MAKPDPEPMPMLFPTLSLCCAGLFLAGAVVCGRLTRTWPDLWKNLPRERRCGAILGAVCLFWAASHLETMLQGGSAKLLPLAYAAALVLSGMAYLYLDFLFARALGGILILLANYLVHEAFAMDIPGRQAYAVVCYAFGVAGMGIAAAPWLLRDLLDKTGKAAAWRWVTAGLLTAAALLLAVLPLCARS